MRAWEDGDVQRAATLLVTINRLPILQLAIQQLTVQPTSPRPLAAVVARALSVLRVPTTDPLANQVTELFEMCHRIATDVTGPRTADWPGLRRGALLERLVYMLIADRAEARHHEARFSVEGWESGCQDIVGVGDAPYVEVYEAKTDVADLTGEPQELARIRASVEHLGEVVVAVATLMTDDYVDAIVDGNDSIPEDVMRVTQETILGLAVRWPTDPLRTAA